MKAALAIMTTDTKPKLAMEECHIGSEKVKIYGLEDARKIEIVERVTPTAGKEFTILRQLFGNIGRFEPTGK